MINIEFKFVHEPRLIRNQYVLAVDYMHGDADGDTTEEHTYGDSKEDVARLKQDLLGLITFCKMDSDFDNAASDIAPIFEAQGIEDAYAEAEAWVDDFYEGDISCDGNAAGLTGYSLIYYDDAGDRFEVELYINDQKVE